jgi:hypothetical protein
LVEIGSLRMLDRIYDDHQVGRSIGGLRLVMNRYTGLAWLGLDRLLNLARRKATCFNLLPDRVDLNINAVQPAQGLPRTSL